jgi:endonuclease/exonuclease/phosphatase family metal-dependent hydrolase
LIIVSLNTGGGRLFPELIDWVAATKADVWCFQEVTRAPGGGGGWADYRDGDLRLPQRTDLYGDLAAVLPGHDGMFLPAASGLLTDAEGRPVASAFGLATFVRSDLAIVRTEAGFIHGRFSPQGWGAHPRPRNAHGLTLFDRDSGRETTIVQLHGLRDPAGKHDTPAREAQALALAGLVTRLADPSREAVVVCGDFNLLPESATLSRLSALSLRDQVTGRGHTDTRTSHYAKPGRHANYMLTSRVVEVRRFEVVAAPEVSDHRALLMEIG